MNSDFIVLIPAYQPESPLLDIVKELGSHSFKKIIVVDDGNGRCKNAEDYNSILSQVEKQGVTVLHHEKNEGKGQSLKTGFNYIVKKFSDCKGVITVDCDGQHIIDDILKVSQALYENPQKLVIAVRDLMGEKVPLGDRIGDTLAAGFFKFSTRSLTCVPFPLQSIHSIAISFHNQFLD